MPTLVLIRHGQSQWNLENRFTGWVDVTLSPKGEEEATQAGRDLKAKGFTPDVAYTSALQRAQKTLDIVLKELGLTESLDVGYRLSPRGAAVLARLSESPRTASGSR